MKHWNVKSVFSIVFFLSLFRDVNCLKMYLKEKQ